MAKYLGIPIALTRGTSNDTSTPSSILFDITANVFDGIKVGDVVVNTTTMAQATVTSIDLVSTGLLNISSDIFSVVSGARILNILS